MRIRRHAKLAGLMLSATASTSTDLSPPPPPPRLQSRICHLNQSPWDVISFPPDSASSPYQVDGEDSFTANGSFGDSIGAVESVASLKIIDGEENINVNNLKNDAPKHAFPIAHENVEEKIEVEDMEEEREDQVFCCKTDGKGWQCKEKASRGHSLCDHHLAQLRKYNSLAHPSSKKLEKPPAAAIRRRPRHNKAAVASNPYEFYYYSGFGPRWGKKRGTRGEPSNPTNASAAAAAAAANKSDRVEEIITSQIDHEEFDYVDDDDDEDLEDENEEESGESGKKRTRKPIKARSLKSLM